MTNGNLAGTAELSQDQQDLVNLLLEEAGIEVEQPQTILPREGDRGTAPLSFAQQRLWFLDQLDPGSPVYNMFAAWEVRGRLDPGVLRASLNGLAQRHESLRTTFTELEGEPVQAIAPASRLPLAVVDLTRLSGGAMARRVTELAGEEARRPFDLARGPLLRATALRLGEEEWALVVVLHHVVSDGWSVRVFFREWSVLYEAFSAGRPSPLAELPIQYADFACWQRERLAGEALDREIAHWKAVLGGGPAALELPTDRPRPARRRFRGALSSSALPGPLAADLEALGERCGATLFMTLLAVFEAVCYRYTGQESFTVGTPIANRHHAETEDLIGFFVNTLVLGAELGRETSFAGLLGRARETALDAYDHQDLPFEKLVEALAPERDRTRTPFFQVMFAFDEAAAQTIELPGLEWAPLGVASGTAKFDLTLTVEEGEGDLAVTVEYDRDLFDGTTVDRFSRHFVSLAAAAASDSEAAVAELGFLSPAERHHLLQESNDSRTGAPLDAVVHELFEEQAGRAPDALAVSFRGSDGSAAAISYRETNRRADRWARRLRRLGVRPEVPVGLCLERSAELVVATLGVLKAGGAYLPLDPGYPRERLAFMLEDSGTPVVLVADSLRERLPDSLPRTVPVVPGRAPGASSGAAWERTAHHVAGARADNLAYVMYTSGSTGRSKGVGIPHRAVVRLVSHTDYVELGPGDRVAQVANTSFDAATFEIWGALANGAQVCMLSKEVVLSARDLAGELVRQRLDALFLTTALFNQVVREDPGAFASLEHLLFGGEAVDPGRVREALAGGSPRRLLHVYGPTESTTFTTWQRVRTVDPAAANVPIGGPVANTRVRLLDRHGRPVAIGVTGELSIGGAGLARGYLRRPRLTAERFVPDGISELGGERLYATGDLARHLAGGRIEFLGRLDHQVKIRGFRIEPGEVEAALVELEPVLQAAVLARPAATGTGIRQLVAYVVAATATSPAELGGLLRGTLPEYMVPSAFVLLDKLPLNANGKLDRQALPAPDETARPRAARVAPRNAVEQFLAELWCEVLGVERVSVHDGFFELGGHSLLATQVVSQVRAVLHVDLPLRRLFEASTVAELAAAVAEEEPKPGQAEKLARLLLDVRKMSAEETRRRLAAEEGVS